MLLGAGEPVADRHEIFVIGAAPRAGREVPPHRGLLVLLQRADNECRKVIAPSSAALGHLLSLLSGPGPSFPGGSRGTGLVTLVSNRPRSRRRRGCSMRLVRERSR